MSMKRSVMIMFAAVKYVFPQNIGIGTTTPGSSAMPEIKSNDKGLLIPRTSTTARVTIPAAGDKAGI